ncbi:2,3-diaminopropionate biosynthesis protein SbnB [Micromonospora sp. DT201]|uniref:2,3-diaminopropionate biosynthesis protein SbnB n=1 Tax=Micromonospora sp. DT201 TaxID=3393442 RepID=UPI003CEEB4B0
MTSEDRTPSFSVISGAQVHQVLHGREKDVVRLVENAYRLHGQGETVNPPSYFLRFPDRPSSRIIALPASIGGDSPVDGIKWISSFPENIHEGLPRASALAILNDPRTGYPYACLEASIVSATRTAASAALAADWLSRDRPRPRRVGIIGAGLIARYTLNYLTGDGWSFDTIGVHDLAAEQAASFGSYCADSHPGSEVVTYDTAEELIRSCDLIVFATVASTPHVDDPTWFAHNPIVLHLSLRDLAPEVLLTASNIVDDVEHCLKAATSPHLTEQLTGARDFLDGTLYDVMAGAVRLPSDKPIVFSPFGLGVLDLAVSRHIHDELAAAGELRPVEDFFFDLSRHANPSGSAAREG